MRLRTRRPQLKRDPLGSTDCTGTMLARTITLALSLATASAHGQAKRPGPSPEKTVQQLFHALDAKDWLAAVRFIHPRALASFRAEQLRDAGEWRFHPMMLDSSLSPPVRAYFDSMQVRLRKGGNPSLAMFGGVPSTVSLARIPPDQLLALYWQTRDPKPQNYDRGIAPRSERAVLGAVIGSDTLAYVVYRETWAAPGSTLSPELYVIEVRRDHGVWRCMLNRDIGTGSWAMIATPADST